MLQDLFLNLATNYALGTPYNFNDKESCVRYLIAYMLARCQRMFSYGNLPEQINKRALNIRPLCNGFLGWFEDDNGILRIDRGGFGGIPNENYMPTEFIVTNPALKTKSKYIIGKDCVIMPNDSMYLGLIPMFSRYATAIVENEITMRLANINLRIPALISASDGAMRESAEMFIKRLCDGELSIVGDDEFLKGVTTAPYSNTNSNSIMTSLIEYEQYLKAGWYNEIGLDANYNMKREALNTTESQMNSDALKPLVDDMLECRKDAIEQVNKMFGTNITVELNSSWKVNHEDNKPFKRLDEEENEVTSNEENKTE